MKHLAFVILHYQSIDDTKECVDSIVNNVDYHNYNIIVVDNASPNKSGEKLKKYYKNKSIVSVIISDKNLGFAKGNNIGFNFAKYEFKSDFIVLLNSDTIITQKDFVKLIIDKYDDRKFHVMGPDIITLKEGIHQNPVSSYRYSKKNVRIQILRFKVLLLFNKFRLENICRKLVKKVKRLKSNTKNSKKEISFDQNIVKLHGSCLIFSKDYIERYNGLYEETFMYGEEDILSYISYRDSLNMIYYPRLKIIHKEDGSLNESYNEDYERNRFVYKHSLDSSKVLLKLMKKESIR